MLLRLPAAGAACALFGLLATASLLAAQPGPARFVQVSAGQSHSCGLTDQGAAYCWGGDILGAAGDGDPDPFAQLRAVAVAMPPGVRFTRITTGTSQSCALATGGQAYCWGADTRGEVGDGPPMAKRNTPVQVAAPAGTTFTDISAGTVYTCAVASTGKAYCWGINRWNVLGTGGRVSGDQPAPVEVGMPPGARFTSIAAGYAGTCALATGGKAYCWGAEAEAPGILGDGPAATAGAAVVEVSVPAGVVPTAIGVGAAHACLLAASGKVYCWGSDARGQLGNGPGGESLVHRPVEVPAPNGVVFASLTVGAEHTCAATADGQVYCWGEGDFGRLGVWGEPGSGQAPVSAGGYGRYRQVAAGTVHTCGVDGDGGAYCWGDDTAGQLGDGGRQQASAYPMRVLLPGEPESRND